MPPAQVSISVEGGTQSDWVATAANVAEQSSVNNVTFSTVEVYVPNPWGDFRRLHQRRWPWLTIVALVQSDCLGQMSNGLFLS
jgi:hypothetical protein